MTPAMSTFQVCANTDPLRQRCGYLQQHDHHQRCGRWPHHASGRLHHRTRKRWPDHRSTPAAKFSQIGIFRGSSGTFVLDANGNNAFDLPADKFAQFGQAGDIPVAGDWDGTGVVRIGVYRPSNGHWYLDMNNNGQWDGAELDWTLMSSSALLRRLAIQLRRRVWQHVSRFQSPAIGTAVA